MSDDGEDEDLDTDCGYIPSGSHHQALSPKVGAVADGKAPAASGDEVLPFDE